MFTTNLIILSYHHFTESPEEYQFSRTFKQFGEDLNTIKYDWITIDDGRDSQIQACNIMKQKNIRAKLFINTSFVGSEGYCNWFDISRLSKYHDIENHSHVHTKHTFLNETEILESVERANKEIEKYTGRKPRYFVPPYNTFNSTTVLIAKSLGLELVKNRITILNDTELSNDNLKNVMIGSSGKTDYKF